MIFFKYSFTPICWITWKVLLATQYRPIPNGNVKQNTTDINGMVTFMDFIMSFPIPPSPALCCCVGWFAVISLVLYHWVRPDKIGIKSAVMATKIEMPEPPFINSVNTFSGVYAMFIPKNCCIRLIAWIAFSPPAVATLVISGNAAARSPHCLSVNLYKRSTTLSMLE